MAVISDIYEDLVNALKTVIDEKYIFSDRPNVNGGDRPMAKFIIVDLPVSIRDIAVGNRGFMYNTRGLFSVFVKSKSNNTLQVGNMSSLVEDVMNLFPVSGSKCVAANPVPLMRGSDKNGYHFTEISFEIHTK